MNNCPMPDALQKVKLQEEDRSNALLHIAARNQGFKEEI
jgi:hypothetical protein